MSGAYGMPGAISVRSCGVKRAAVYQLQRLGLVFRGAQVDEACAERVLGLFECHRILRSETVSEMQGWGHSGGFSVHAGVRVAAPDRAGRERLLRYCARPMFAGERLVWAGRKCATGCHGRRWRGTSAGSRTCSIRRQLG